jgi:oxygen-dependent protoporphyrinogen oxidase
MARVVVVGAGISGLATALAVADRNAARIADGALTIEVLEASDRVGGKLRASPFAGLPAVDEGADSFLARSPEAVALARRVGLGDTLTSPTGARAAVWYDGLHDLPEGLLLGVPVDALRLATSRLLTVRGKARAALEPLLPRRDDPEDSIGALIRSRFGNEVHERLVDALVGSIYAADTDRFSLAMVPQLAALAAGHRSLVLAGRAMRAQAPPAGGPIFFAPRAGMATLAEATAVAAGAAGVHVRCSTPVQELAPDGGRWRVDGAAADVVVLATPARPSAPLLRSGAPEAAELLARMHHASVAIVTIAVPGWPPHLRGRSGYLVPKPVQRTVTAASFGSQKWAHWASAAGEVVRVSLGRVGLPVDHLDDATVCDRAVDELSAHTGVDVQPVAARVTRWPDAFPQYRPHHPAWRAAVDAALPPGLLVTGASYGGIGVPACIAQAGAVAARVDGRLWP